MKIGILTHQLSGNYGGILQNFAMQKVLQNLGHIPVTIDYIKDIPWGIKILSIIKRTILKLLKKSKLPIRGWTTKAEERIIYKNTREFVEKYIKTTKQVDISNIGKFDAAFDAVIIGSDQVWRYAYMKQHILHFFGKSLGNTTSIISYASSFGTDSWEMPNDVTEQCQKLIQKFSAVSVRESSGVHLCAQYLDVKAQHVLDPTMLISKDEYMGLLNRHDKKSKGIVTYILDQTPEKNKVISYISEYMGHQISSIATPLTYENAGSNQITKCIVPPIEDWLSGILNADFVVTDSFHGTAFSIIFNKPFIVIGNVSRGLSRQISILEKLGLEDRLITKFDLDSILTIMKTSIDWDKINAILDREKEASIKFIVNGLKHNN